MKGRLSRILANGFNRTQLYELFRTYERPEVARALLQKDGLV